MDNTQCTLILNLLKSGKSITSYDAFSEYGITRLSAVIFNLKKAGYEIASFNRKSVNRYGHTVSFTEYRLKDPSGEK